jgi:hypothetical protein
MSNKLYVTRTDQMTGEIHMPFKSVTINGRKLSAYLETLDDFITHNTSAEAKRCCLT